MYIDIHTCIDILTYIITYIHTSMRIHAAARTPPMSCHAPVSLNPLRPVRVRPASAQVLSSAASSAATTCVRACVHACVQRHSLCRPRAIHSAMHGAPRRRLPPEPTGYHVSGWTRR